MEIDLYVLFAHEYMYILFLRYPRQTSNSTVCSNPVAAVGTAGTFKAVLTSTAVEFLDNR